MRKRYFLYYDNSLFVPRRNEDKTNNISSFKRKSIVKTILSMLTRQKPINFILLYDKKKKKCYYLSSDKITLEELKEKKISELKFKYRAENAKIMEIKDMAPLKDFGKHKSVLKFSTLFKYGKSKMKCNTYLIIISS